MVSIPYFSKASFSETGHPVSGNERDEAVPEWRSFALEIIPGTML
jgi:hypothetical protein